MTYDELKKLQVGGKHYKFSIQPWDFYRAFMTREQWVGYLKGNIIDYLVRDKNGLEDLKKAQHVLNVLVATEEEHEEKKETEKSSGEEPIFSNGMCRDHPSALMRYEPNNTIPGFYCVECGRLVL
jgi:hypothetical protein